MGLFTYAVEQFGKKALESGAERVAEHAVASKVASAAASEAGQKLITNYAGQRAASAAASKPGQFVIKRMARNAIKPDKSGDQKPAPAAEAPATQPNVNLQQTIQSSVHKAMRSYTGGGGRGAGWWNTMQQPGEDWRKIGDLSVARGPAKWDLPGGRVGAFAGGVARGVLAQRAANKGGEGDSESTWPAPTPAADWNAPALPASGMKASAASMSAINANIGSSYSGTNSRNTSFDLGKDYISRSPVGSFSTWPKPPTVKQEPGQVTPYKRTGPWVSSAGGSFT